MSESNMCVFRAQIKYMVFRRVTNHNILKVIFYPFVYSLSLCVSVV